MKTIGIGSKHQEGFTFVEIAILLILVSVLIGIIFVDYSGAKARSRNDIRTAAIKSLRDYIEIFYSQNTYYPSLSDMNNPSWLAINLKPVTQAMFTDPSWTAKNTACTKDGKPILIRTSVLGCYGYNPTNNGVSCEQDDTTCNDYTLTATLEAGQGVYRLRQLD